MSFLQLDGIRIKNASIGFAEPKVWEEKFGKQIHTIEFDKPVYALVMKNGRLTRIAIHKLEGLRYQTFFPFGESSVAENDIPIVFQQQNLFDVRSPFILVSSGFLKQLNLDKARATQRVSRFGSEDFPGMAYQIGIDFNSDGQYEILSYTTEVQDNITQDDDERSASTTSIIATYFKNKWFRTSFWEQGQDGMEGF